MLYARKKGSDTWHWFRNCSQLPKKYEVVNTGSERPIGDLCDQCKSKERRGVGVPLERP